jgi:hypothetical protein
MAKIKLTIEPSEVYFKKTTNYELSVDGKPLTIRIEEDSNEGHIHYKHKDGWSEEPPEWICEIGEDDWGELIFERTIWENLSCMAVNEEIYTHEDDEL